MDHIATARAVHDRLASTPGVQRGPTDQVELFLLRDFLAPAVCAKLCERIDARRKPSPLFMEHPDPEFRTSETCNLDPAEPAVAAVDAALTALTGLDPAHGERLQGQRYGPGQQFKAHHDYLSTAAPYWERQERVGGQRTWTAMVFLDRPRSGGETYFPLIELLVPPRMGTLLVWNNLDAAGAPNRMTLHQGVQVRAGVKHIVTKWWRERPWGPEIAGPPA